MIDQIKNHFGLTQMPFSKTIGTRELYQGAAFREMCARLEMALENEDIALVTGAAGSGKTSAVRYFLGTLDPKAFKIAYIASDRFKIGEIAKQALAALGMTIPHYPSTALRLFKRTVQDLHKLKGIKPILVIDEAQELPLETLTAMKSILNYEMDSQNLLFLLLCGQKELEEKLELNPLEALNRRIRIRYSMKELSVEETSQFIRHQMEKSGVSRAVFGEEAIAEIYNRSKGVISSVNKLCFSLLIAAASKKKEIIDPSMVSLAS